MERYCVNLVLLWNTLVSPSMVIESLAGYSSLGWHLCSLSVCITSVQVLLAFIVSALVFMFSLYYPLKSCVNGKIMCEFGFVMEYFGSSIYGN